MGTNKLILTIVCLALVLTTVPAATLGQGGATHTVCPDGPPTCDHSSIQAAINEAEPGDAVEVAAGTYAESLYIGKEDITLAGAGADQVLVDASGSPGRGITADASGFNVSGLTVSDANSYGVKIEIPGGGPDLTDIEVRDLIIENSASSELDLHGVDGAVIQNVTARGLDTSGNGMAVTDSHNVTFEDVTTEGNTWGGLAIYTSGSFTTGGTSGITLAGANDLAEINPLYIQLHEDGNGELIPAEDLDLQGFPMEVAYGSAPTFTFLQEGVTNALENVTVLAGDSRLDIATATVLDTRDGHYHVTDGMSIQPGLEAAPSDGTVEVHDGLYEEQLLISSSVTLQEAGDPVIQAPASLAQDADGHANLITIAGEDVEATLTGLTIQGPGPGGCGSIDSGIAVRDGAHATIEDNTISAIRDGPLSGCQNGVGVTVGHVWFADSESTATADISGNTFEDFQKSAVVVAGDGSQADVTENDITCSGSAADDTIAQDGIQLWDNASAQIMDNTIEECRSTSGQRQVGVGIHLNEGTRDTRIAGNEIPGAQTAIALMNYWPGNTAEQHVRAENITIEDNVLTDNDGAVYLAGSADGVDVTGNNITGASVLGVFIGPDTWLAGPPDFTNVSITENNLVDNDAPALFVRDSVEAISAHFNVITGNELGALNEEDSALDATHNWWGSPLGPTHDGNTLGNGQEVGDRVAYGSWCLLEDCTVQRINHDLNLRPHH